MATLTNKQRLYCEFYVSNKLNGTQAAISAGYKEKTAASISSENLNKPHIMEYIRELQAVTSEKLEITRESQLNDLQAIKKAASEAEEFPSVLKAIEIQNKMLGLNEPDKLNVTQYTATVDFADR